MEIDKERGFWEGRWPSQNPTHLSAGAISQLEEQRMLAKIAPSNQLALEGGAPVRAEFLPFGAPCLGQEEIDEVVHTLRSGWIGTGPKAQRFEQEFARYVGAPHALALNSCTAG